MVISRQVLFRAIAWTHVLLIGVPFAEFVIRGLAKGGGSPGCTRVRLVPVIRR